MINTGPGKGKSTAAFGLALRMLGTGRRVGIVQFIKGAWSTGEQQALTLFGDKVVWRTMGRASLGTRRTSNAMSRPRQRPGKRPRP